MILGQNLGHELLVKNASAGNSMCPKTLHTFIHSLLDVLFQY